MAGRIALDLKQFKHVKSDEKSHTLQHRDGHMLTLATKALGPDNQKQLAALAQAAQSSQKPTDRAEAKQDAQTQMADGGDIRPHFMGQPQSNVGQAAQDEEDQFAPKESPKPYYTPRPYAEPVKEPSLGRPANFTIPAESIPSDIIPSSNSPDKFTDLSREDMMADGGKVKENPIQMMLPQVPGNPNLPARGIGKGIRIEEDPQAKKSLGKTIRKMYANSAEAINANDSAPEVLDPGGRTEAEVQAANAEQHPNVPSALSPVNPEITKVPLEVVQPNAASAEQDVKIRNRNLMDIYNQIQPIDEPGFRFEDGKSPSKGIDTHLWEKAHEILGERNQAAQAETEKGATERAKQASIMQELGKAPAPTALPPMQGNQQIPPGAGTPGQIAGQMAPSAPGQTAPSSSPGGLGKYGVYQASPTDFQGLYGASTKNLIGAEKAKYDATKALADKQQKDLDDAILAKNTAMATFQRETAANQKERAALQQDIKDGFVDPEKYWTGDKNGNGSHSRLMSAIGMIIAGFNPTSNPNAAINFLQKQMDMNLEAQKANLTAKHNLLRANLDNYKNIRDAADMTRLQQNDYVESQLKARANAAIAPLQQAALMGAIGTIQRDSMKTAMDLDLRRGIMSMTQNPGSLPQGTIGHSIAMMGVMNHPQYKDYLDRYFPAVNGKEQLAGRPVSAKDRDAVDAHQDFDKALTNLQNFVKTHNTWVPGTGNYTEGDVMAKELQTLVRERLMNTVYREGEQPLLDAIVKSNPAGFRKWVTERQLSTLKNVNNRKFDTLKQSLGGTFLQAPPSSVPPHPREGQMGMLNGQRVKMVNGKLEPVR